MPFTPHRIAQPFTTTNVSSGQAISLNAINGVNDAMTQFSERGHLHVALCGYMVNEQKFYPPIGQTYLGLTNGSNNNTYLSRKSICIPVAISPNDTHYSLYLNYRLQPYASFQDTDGILSTVGPDVFVYLTKAGQSYELAHVSFIDQSTVPYFNETFIDARLPTRLISEPVSVDTYYIVVRLDYTSKYKRTPNNAAWYYAGQDDTRLDDQASVWPNLLTFWNGVGGLTFATHKPCEPC